MTCADHRAAEFAARHRNLATRAALLQVGVSDEQIDTRLRTGILARLHAGTYLFGAVAPDWLAKVEAAVLAAGSGAVVSHRAAVMLWALDGIGSAPVELTVPYADNPVPAGVIVHRSRRLVVPSLIGGIPVTPIDRTLIDAAACLPSMVVEKALESAVRRRLTTPAKLDRFLREECGKGVRGTRVLKLMLAERPEGGPAGSGGEVELLRAIRKAGVEPPVRQFEIGLPDGSKAVVDMAWPLRRKLVELDGLDAHGSADALENDLERQNDLLDLGWELRRWSGRAVRRRPREVAERIVAFLAS